MKKILMLAFIMLMAVFLMACFTKGMQQNPTARIENYGGPVKNVKKIPMTDCYRMCDMNAMRCQQMYPNDNVGKCSDQWQSCRGECYFSNAQRM
jgi:hypothetical protein